MFEGSFKHAEAEIAVKFLETHLNNFLQSEIDRALLPAKIDAKFLRDETEKLRNLFKKTEDELIEYVKRFPGVTLAQDNYRSVKTMEDRLATVDERIAGYKAQLADIRQQLLSIPKFEKQQIDLSNPYKPQIAQIDSEIAGAKASGQGPQHPNRIKLAKRRRELVALSNAHKGDTSGTASLVINPAYAQLKSNESVTRNQLQAARAERRQIEQEVKKQRKRLATLPKEQAEYERLFQLKETYRTQFKTLSTKLKNSELQLEREQARSTAQYDIIVHPRLDIIPSGQSRKTSLMIGAGAGFGISFLLAAIILLARGRLTLAMIMGTDEAADTDTKTSGETPDLPALESGERATPEQTLPTSRTKEKALPPQTADGE